MSYLDKLEDKVQDLEEREKLWKSLALAYSHLVRKYQTGKQINRQNTDEIQVLKNRLGIGNGVLKDVQSSQED